MLSIKNENCPNCNHEYKLHPDHYLLLGATFLGENSNRNTVIRLYRVTNLFFAHVLKVEKNRGVERVVSQAFVRSFAISVETQNCRSLMRGNQQRTFRLNELNSDQCTEIGESFSLREVDYFETENVIYIRALP